MQQGSAVCLESIRGPTYIILCRCGKQPSLPQRRTSIPISGGPGTRSSLPRPGPGELFIPRPHGGCLMSKVTASLHRITDAPGHSLSRSPQMRGANAGKWGTSREAPHLPPHSDWEPQPCQPVHVRPGQAHVRYLQSVTLDGGPFGWTCSDAADRTKYQHICPHPASKPGSLKP